MARPVRFVGREGELSRLLGALAGDARLVLVVGDAGAGKTRFVTEAMDRAAAGGMVMVRGECLPLVAVLPLLPVRDALGELARLDGGGLLAAALDAAPGYVREEVARLLPGMDSRLLGALAGDARLVLVVGDAGAGKTRFVAEATDRAAAAGMVMVRGECLPLAGTLPLLPVGDALGELARLDGGGLLAAALDAAPGYVREEVGRLLPGMGQGGGTGPAGRDGEWSRERLFAGAAEVLAAVAAGRRPGWGWLWRTCTGRTVRRWIS